MKKNIKWLTFKTKLSSLCNWPLVLECNLDSMSSILVSLSHDLLVWLIKSSQVELYCHSATCVGPRCYINLLCNWISLITQKDLAFALQENWIIKTYSVIGVPFCPFQPHVAHSQACFSTFTPISMGKSNTVLHPRTKRGALGLGGTGWGSGGAYLWLTNWRLTGLGQWNPVCLWVCVSDLAFSIVVLPLGVTVFSFYCERKSKFTNTEE